MQTLFLPDVQRLAEAQHWLVEARQLRALGVTPSQVSARLRRGEWLALFRGVYLVDAEMYDDIPTSLWWHAALRAHGADAMLAGRTAVRALGVQGLPPDDPAIEIVLRGCLSRARRRDEVLPGAHGIGPPLVVRQLQVEADAVIVDGMRVCPPQVAVVDAALQLGRTHALCVLDSALHLELVPPELLARAVDAARGRRGCRVLREVAALADARAESPLESRIRLCCIDGDVAPDDLQHEVADGGHVIAVGDLAWLRRRRPLLGECDGVEPHSRPQPVFRDRRRGNSLTGLAHDTVRFTWADSARPAYVQWVVRRALAAGAA